MKPKTVRLRFHAAIWLAGVSLFVAGCGKQDAELAAQRARDLDSLHAELEQVKAEAAARNTEVAKMRKDNEELLRLRNEVSQLRGDKQRLSTQLQTAESQAQAQALRPNTAQPVPPGQANPAAQAAFNARYGLAATNSEQAFTAVCINNLRLIDGAKQQWALENQKPRGALLTAADLTPYVKSNALPVCPAGGVYTLNPIGLAPICNIPGHALLK